MDARAPSGWPSAIYHGWPLWLRYSDSTIVGQGIRSAHDATSGHKTTQPGLPPIRQSPLYYWPTEAPKRGSRLSLIWTTNGGL